MMTEDLPVLLMLIGIPGSGKSTWLDSLPRTNRDGGIYLLVNDKPFYTICPDEIRKRKTHISDQTINIEVWQEAQQTAIGCLEHGTSVLLDATNVNTSYRKLFISGVKGITTDSDKGPRFQLWAKLFPVQPDIAWNRVKAALDAGIDRSAVPEDVIYRMYGEFLYTSKVLESEGFKIL